MPACLYLDPALFLHCVRRARQIPECCAMIRFGGYASLRSRVRCVRNVIVTVSPLCDALLTDGTRGDRVFELESGVPRDVHGGATDPQVSGDRRPAGVVGAHRAREPRLANHAMASTGQAFDFSDAQRAPKARKEEALRLRRGCELSRSAKDGSARCKADCISLPRTCRRSSAISPVMHCAVS
jgi:hypothetical protein